MKENEKKDKRRLEVCLECNGTKKCRECNRGRCTFCRGKGKSWVVTTYHDTYGTRTHSEPIKG